ncbi:MAG: hypothetical protein LQ341_005265 [Variospora aurantia]|nr:MAG: hypothetical protein LQ341_005265 [Variospora aurantia]
MTPQLNVVFIYDVRSIAFAVAHGPPPSNTVFPIMLSYLLSYAVIAFFFAGGVLSAGPASHGESEESAIGHHLPSKATVVIVTIKPEVVRGTFIPSTLSKYDSLSSKTIITSTKSEEKPVTLVVGPGGVAWVPFRPVSGAAHVPAPSKPPKPSGHHETGSKDQDQSTKGSGFASRHPPGRRVPDKSRPEQASERSSTKTGKSPARTKDPKSTREATKRPVGPSIPSPRPRNTESEPTRTREPIDGSNRPTQPSETKSSPDVTRKPGGTEASQTTKAPNIFIGSAPSTVITESGITGTYRRQTYSEYANPQSTTLITTSAMVEDDNGYSHPTVFPVVVGLGGVHWTPTCSGALCPGGEPRGGRGGIHPPSFLGVLCPPHGGEGGGGGGEGGDGKDDDNNDEEDNADDEDEEEEEEEEQQSTSKAQKTKTNSPISTSESSSSSSSGGTCLLRTTIWPLPIYTLEDSSTKTGSTMKTAFRSKTKTAPSGAASVTTAACSLKTIPPAPETPPPEADPTSISSLGLWTDPKRGSATDKESPSSTRKAKPTRSEPPNDLETTEAPPKPAKTKPPSHPTVAPVEPPSPARCKPPPKGDYQDAHQEAMEEAVYEFCGSRASKVIPKDERVDIRITKQDEYWDQFLDNNDSADDIYNIIVKNVPYCVPGEKGYNLLEPVKGHACEMVLEHAWNDCE